MVISIDINSKTFHKIQHPSVIQTLKELGISSKAKPYLPGTRRSTLDISFQQHHIGSNQNS